VKILIIGAGGMVGRKLTQRLAALGAMNGAPVAAARLVDITAPAAPNAPFATICEAMDIADPARASALVSDRPEVVFQLASIVSGEAESDFDKGYRVNLDGGRAIFDAIRREHLRSGGAYRPRVIFTSSIAVFGAPFPEMIGDEFFTTPLTSYGTQKAILELLLSDYSRRGFFEGVALRLPTICVRPGAPNLAASGFFSNIIREPLVGKQAVLPVPDSVRHWHASPRSAIGFLLHAASLDPAKIGPRRALTMPGVSVTVAEQIEALRQVAGDDAVKLIRREPNETIARIVAGWPTNFNAVRATALGFQVERNFVEIIEAHIADELGAKVG
jgi:D-erythronate 2-dehydrogenase